MIEKYPYLKQTYGFQSNDFGAIVAAASLAHDIGNPPFGHSGEMAIGDFFKNGYGKKFKENLSDQQYKDLCYFEGNANGFKILSENKAGIKGGLRLSYATLAPLLNIPEDLYFQKNQLILKIKNMDSLPHKIHFLRR